MMKDCSSGALTATSGREERRRCNLIEAQLQSDRKLILDLGCTPEPSGAGQVYLVHHFIGGPFEDQPKVLSSTSVRKCWIQF